MLANDLDEKKTADLYPGNRLLCIYGGLENENNHISLFLKEGLNLNEKCLFIYDSYPLEHIRETLAEKGLQLDLYVDSGQFVFHRLTDPVNPHGLSMLTLYEFLINQRQEAILQGYSTLRVVAETSLENSDEAAFLADTKTLQMGTAICLSTITVSE